MIDAPGGREYAQAQLLWGLRFFSMTPDIDSTWKRVREQREIIESMEYNQRCRFGQVSHPAFGLFAVDGVFFGGLRSPGSRGVRAG